MSSRDAAPRRSLAGGALVGVASQVVALLAAAPTSIVIARATGPDGTAAFGLSASLIATGTVVFSFGLSAGVTFFVSRQALEAQAAMRSVERAAVSLGAIAAIALLGARAAFAGTFLSGVTLTMAAAIALALPAALAYSFLCAIALATERYEQYGAGQAFQAVTTLLGVLLLVWPLGALGAVIALAASYVFGYALLRIMLTQSMRPHARGRPQSLLPAFRFGSRAWGADLLQLLNYRFDLFILNAYASQAIVGQYAVAVSLTALAWLLPSSMQMVLFPRTASMTTASEDAQDATVIAALRHTIVLLSISTLVLILILASVPLVYGVAFHKTVIYGALLLPGVVMIGLAKPIGAVLTGRGHPRYSFYNALCTAPITILLYIYLVPRMQGEGAALASSVSYTLSLALAAYFLQRATGISILSAFTSPRTLLADYSLATHSLRAYIKMRLGR